ncbi:MAG TPA: hypothetical protein VK982_11755, partial [Bacteroidales bacterium]|nr:hypothetical protein [Bacteroidales bacterium]
MKRLKQLENNGYIKIIECTPEGENVYCVTKKLDNTYIKKTNKLLHCFACADFYFYIKSQHKRIREISIEICYYYVYNNKKYTFRPDIFIDTDRKLLVEIDLSNRRFKEKVKKWEGFYTSGGYYKYFKKYP